MKHTEIEEIIKKRFEKINIAFNQIGTHFKEDDIRRFRVKVKKLQACLSLMGDEKKRHPIISLLPKLVKYYKFSGTIRTLQMQEQKIRETSAGENMALPETYLDLLANKILDYTAKANKLLGANEPFKKEELNVLSLLPHHLSQTAIDNYIEAKGHELKKSIAPIFPGDQLLHEIRKTLKNLLYINPYIEINSETSMPFAMLSKPEDLDSFTVVLGDFHDLNVAIECLHTESFDIEIDEREKEVLRNIELLWIKEKTAVHKKIYDRLQKIIASKLPAASQVKWPVM